MEPIQDTEISTKAVLLGFLVDIGCTFALGILSGVVGIAQALRGGIGMQELGAKLPEVMTGPLWLFFGMLTGMGSTVFGGYIAGRIAGRAQVLHGAVMGGLSLLLGIAEMRFSSKVDLPFWYIVMGVLLTIPAAMWGASLAHRPEASRK